MKYGKIGALTVKCTDFTTTRPLLLLFPAWHVATSRLRLPPPCGYRWRAPIRWIQGKRASFSPSSSALLYSDMILAVHGSYQHCVPLRSLLCRERQSQLRSLLRKEHNILLRSWSNPGDQACGKAIQLALRTLNDLFRLPTWVSNPHILNTSLSLNEGTYIPSLNCQLGYSW